MLGVNRGGKKIMGMLISMAYKENPNYCRGKANYSNKNAVENVIRYVTRSRPNEDRADSLISYGGSGVRCYGTPEEMINQFLYVQYVYNIDRRGGRRLYHEVFNLTDEDFKRLCFDLNQVNIFAQTICNVYYKMGHQVVYAIHYEPEEHLHIHFVVNTINFRTGRKWHEYKASTACREMLFNEILRNQECIIIKKIANIC